MRTPRPRTLDRQRLYQVTAALLALLCIVAAGEILARAAIAPHKKSHPPTQPDNEMRRVFQHDPILGWLPTPHFDEMVRYPAAAVRVTHNAEGFRESERDPSDPRPEWAVLGDSEAWGYNVEAEDRFSNQLGRHFPDKQFRNYGVSGFGSLQELLVYQHHVREHDPEGVLLLVSGNDRSNNRSSRTRSGYARPHFEIDGDAILIATTPVPDLDPLGTPVPWYRSHLLDALRYRVKRIGQGWDEDPTEKIIRALAEQVHADGRVFALATEERDPGLMALGQQLGIPVIDLAPALAEAGQAAPVKFPRDQGRHLTPWGHRVVAQAFAETLERHLR